MGKGMKRRLFSFLLVMMMLFASVTQVSAAVPSINAAVTKKNILSLMKKYDKSSYDGLKTSAGLGNDITRWWGSSGRIYSEIDTAVHEETHGLVYPKGRVNYSTGKRTFAFHLSSGKYLYVTEGKVYNTKKMASSVPSNLRTFRFSTYVGKPTKYLASNVQGCYGLMNEWCAYYNGMHAGTSLYDYYNEQGCSKTQYIYDGGNGKQAYAEFKYYILHYLYYAKKHYPEVYKDVLNNKEFCKAYKTLDKKWIKQIAGYDAKKYTTGEDSYCIDFYEKPYSILMAEMQKSRYKKIHGELYKRGA